MSGVKRRSRDTYVAIMVAEARGKGLRLSFEELQDLTLDDAIATRAANALTAEEWQTIHAGGLGAWAKIDPYKDRIAANGVICSEERTALSQGGGE